MRTQITLLIITILVYHVTAEIITVSLIGSAFVAGGWYKWDTIKDNTVCRFTECCNDVHVPYDMDSKCSGPSQLFR